MSFNFETYYGAAPLSQQERRHSPADNRDKYDGISLAERLETIVISARDNGIMTGAFGSAEFLNGNRDQVVATTAEGVSIIAKRIITDPETMEWKWQVGCNNRRQHVNPKRDRCLASAISACLGG